jgi:tRNA A-37 threonylcarbamoyl transferase component Bud32
MGILKYGMLRMLALEDVSKAVGDLYLKGAVIPQEVKTSMILALEQIHSAGFLHGDIARHNFCVKDGVVYILDLEDAVRSDVLSKRIAECQALEAL